MKGHQGSSLLGVAKNAYIKQKGKTSSVMAQPFKLSSEANITIQLIERKSSHSVSCNIENDADKG